MEDNGASQALPPVLSRPHERLENLFHQKPHEKLENLLHQRPQENLDDSLNQTGLHESLENLLNLHGSHETLENFLNQPGPQERLESLLNQPGNRICADCGSPDPKWVSLSLGVFICIKCSGVHRSLGVHISKVLSVKLDEWTEQQVDSLVDSGGNAVVNKKYEAFLPERYKKPKPNSSTEERIDFIRRKYELQQFSSSSGHGENLAVPTLSASQTQHDKKNFEKQHTGIRLHGLGSAFRNSWRKKEPDNKSLKKYSTMGMVEFVGLIKVNIIRGTNLAVRDVMTSDPYVILTMGHQSMKTRVIKSSLNPIWNERIMLSIPESLPPLKLQVYDKDTFSTDDRMGEAEIDIQPLVSAAKSCEGGANNESMPFSKCLSGEDNTFAKEGITIVDGTVKQVINLKLQNVERGELEIELECVPLSQ